MTGLPEGWATAELPTGNIPQEVMDDHLVNPEYEMHVGRVIRPGADARHHRYVSIWIQGKRWYGLLSEER